MHSPVSAEAAAQERPLSLGQRMVAIFTSPSNAWGGLRQRAQWWFPILVVLLVTAVSTLLVYDQAIVPMMVEQWETMVESGRMSPEGLEGAQRFMTGPVGKVVTIVQQVIVLFLVQLLVAFLIWFGCGFVLGSKIGFRLALEVAAWSSLVTIPNGILTSFLGAARGSLQGVHTGFGILVASDEPSRLMTGLGVFLDALGPFSIWYVAVAVIGASTLSGAPRSRVAWVLGAIYLTLAILMAVGAAMTAPNA